MNTSTPRMVRIVPALALAMGLVLVVASLVVSCGPKPEAQTTNGPGAPPPGTNTTTAGTTNPPANPSAAASPTGTNAPSTAGAPPPGGGPPGVMAGPDGAPPPTGATSAPPQELQVSFQGANVDMLVQWLAQMTGKSVIKHPRVQCQLTIVSSRKVSLREAIDLVYRGLALEGFNAVETSTSILIVPEGQDIKMSPEVVTAADRGIPEGRQRLLKMFTLKHVRPAELRDKVRAVLSEKATIEVDERANALMVTDFNDNLRLLEELIGELDVTAIGDSVIEIFALKHAVADEIGNLMGMILNAQAGSDGGSGSRGGASPSPGPGPMPMPPGGPGGGSSGAGSGGSGGNQVRIWPDKTANRLVVSSPQSRLVEVRRLVEILDTDKPEDIAVRVLPLRHVQALDLVKEISPLYQKLSSKSLKDMIEVAANERSNSLIILSSQSNFEAIRDLVAALDTEEAQEKVTRTFSLRNADAQDVARQLQELSQGADDSSRYPYYIFYSGMNQQNSKKLSVVADRRRNALVVQAPPAQMDGIARMVQELDEPVEDDSLAPRIYTLKYISAVDIEDVLNELFLKRQQRRSYWDYNDNYYSETTDRDVGRLYGRVRITSEPYSNTIIVTANSKENLTVVEEVLKQLDVPSQAGETTLRVPLRFAKAATLANNLNILFAKNGSPPLRQTAPQPAQNAPQNPQGTDSGTPAESNFELGQETREEGYYPWLGGQPDAARSTDGRSASRQVSDLVGRVRVVADLRSNALLVSANMHLLPQIMRLIEELDMPTAQVLIEARIVEVSSDALDKLGVRWSPDGTQVFTADDYDNSFLVQGSGNYKTGFGGLTSVNTPSAGNVSQILTTLRSGLLESTVNLDLLVQFLKKNTDATVLAEPQISIADNEMGRLFVGQQVPFIDKSQTTDVGALNQSFRYKSVGVILEVTPHINSSGNVALRIRAEASAIQPGQTLFGGAILDTRNFRTDVTAKNGEILVLGGIIQKQISDTVRKVPVFGDIPGLGWAFKKKDKTARQVELMVFLRPKVTRTPEEARALLEDLDRKAPLLQRWRGDDLPSIEDLNGSAPGSGSSTTPAIPPSPEADEIPLGPN